MKKLALALAIVVLATSPALAKKYHKRTTDEVNEQMARQAYASVGDHAYNSPYAVYAFGQYQGTDPDPFIRLQLLRDPPSIQQ